ncbi:hypothetical protein CLOP_g13015 [Closterium sp. NIES-67]|nr:hypothetical protein CLOP_g13015 [Closterium sp. NIES-67]
MKVRRRFRVSFRPGPPSPHPSCCCDPPSPASSLQGKSASAFTRGLESIPARAGGTTHSALSVADGAAAGEERTDGSMERVQG